MLAVVRLRGPMQLRGGVAALAAGGVGAVEISLTTPDAIGSIRDLVSNGGDADCVIGAGNVLHEKAAREVIDAGARFVASPTLDPRVVALCRDRNVVCIPGALTPTEILEAHRAAGSLVKVFPASAVGPGYFRDLSAPLPFLRLLPSGGVSLENAAEWIRAGAAALSVGRALVNAESVKAGLGGELAARARAFVERVAEARREKVEAAR